MKDMKDECKRLYSQSYENNDDAHKYEHAEDVMEMALYINRKMNWNVCEKQIIISASIHDMFTDDRKNHHNLGSSYVMNTKDAILDTLSSNEKKYIALAIKEHRGSFTGEYSSLLSECIAAADRGPCDYQIMYNRSLKYHKGDHTKVRKHLIDKFSYDGYVKFPLSYQKIFKSELKILRDQIELLK